MDLADGGGCGCGGTALVGGEGPGAGGAEEARPHAHERRRQVTYLCQAGSARRQNRRRIQPAKKAAPKMGAKSGAKNG